MERPTKQITTPKSKMVLLIAEWISGRQAEYIQEPFFGIMNVGLNGTASMDNEKMQRAMVESSHRELESYIIQVGEEKEPKKCVDLVLDMTEEDTEFVKNTIKEIKENGKKK